MQVSEAMSTPAAAVPLRTSLGEAARQMGEYGVGSVLVVEGGTLRGIVTDRDLAVRGLGRGLDSGTPVEAVMSPRVITVGMADDVDVAYRILRRCGVRRLPVVDGQRVVGMLTVDDLLLDVFQRLADLLGPVAWSILEEPPGPPSTDSPSYGT
ncbi:CBS domain-containing protein [Streptomyces glomeratus]|uniref:CBS domain-containing protein n=1 Tax=Streptomyces glomeratus TaxID=284452 RepID=A0ABP6LPQ5_9ACTN|nr:CBS domain-containing protein [Streptomyces glomeratus]MCF1508606.1 CBS domain-containing protein [Streptomyces glomeratus]